MSFNIGRKQLNAEFAPKLNRLPEVSESVSVSVQGKEIKTGTPAYEYTPPRIDGLVEGSTYLPKGKSQARLQVVQQSESESGSPSYSVSENNVGNAEPSPTEEQVVSKSEVYDNPNPSPVGNSDAMTFEGEIMNWIDEWRNKKNSTKKAKKLAEYAEAYENQREKYMQTCQQEIEKAENDMKNYKNMIRRKEDELTKLDNSDGGGQDKRVKENKLRSEISYYIKLEDKAQERIDSYNSAYSMLLHSSWNDL